MSSRECEIQLNELIEAWELNEALLNQTDIEAIKHLLLENQIQQDAMIKYKLEKEELKKFIEKELDRLVRECSQTYEDSLGKTRLVNEDIYNELKNISNKVQELEGNNE